MKKSELDLRVDQIVKDTKNAYDRREKKLKKILKEAERAEDVYVIGRIHHLLSLCYFDLGSRNKILPHAVKAVDIFEKLNDKRMLARSYNLLGIAYLAQGNYLRAVEYYNRALEKTYRQKKPGIRRDVMQNNIAECYYLMGEYSMSIRLMKKCFSVIRSKSPNDHVNAVIYAINLSDDYEGMEQYENALEALDSVKPDVELLARDVLLWGYYARRCCVLYKIGKLEEAASYADLTIEAVNNGYDSYEFHRDFEKIAKLEVRVGDYERAQGFADILTRYADTNGHTIDKIISKRVQANICIARGESDRALALYKELSGLYEKRVREQNAIQYESQKNVEAASREIANLMNKIRASEEKAERDPLSGLLNRGALIDISSGFYQSAKEKGTMLGGVFLDIDFFKEYNDTYGHAAGDDAIRSIAKACLEEENGNVRFFRYGGDEFLGIVLGYRDGDLEKLALRIWERVRTSGIEHVKNPNGQCLTVSVGIVNIYVKNSDDTVLDIIKYSDKALYHAKAAGKDDVYAICTAKQGELEYRRLVKL